MAVVTREYIHMYMRTFLAAFKCKTRNLWLKKHLGLTQTSLGIKLSRFHSGNTACTSAGSDPLKDSAQQEPFNTEFGASWGTLFFWTFLRHFQMVQRDTAFVRQKIFQAIFQGVMLGTYLHTYTHTCLTYMKILHAMFGGIMLGTCIHTQMHACINFFHALFQ
jgi:hypothetical protein